MLHLRRSSRANCHASRPTCSEVSLQTDQVETWKYDTGNGRGNTRRILSRSHSRDDPRDENRTISLQTSPATVHTEAEREDEKIRHTDGSFILPSLQAAFGITLSPWIGSAGPTVILLYHILLVLAKVPSFPMALNRLAKLCDDLRCQ